MPTTMKIHAIFHVALMIFLISMPTIFHLSEAAGFSVDLLHRDSLQSPSLVSKDELVTNALRRSFNRHKTLSRNHHYYSPQTASSDIIPDNGEYLMRFSLGTPPVETLAIADTGSDLTWVQCKPCQQCFKQKAPLFEPDHSSTYKPLSCDSSACNSLPTASCINGSKGTCSYTIEYGDRSFSMGDLATETVTLGSTSGQNMTIPALTIGCGHFDQGTFGGGSSGIVGLGGGKVSLISHMGSSIQGKFSYCLIPFAGPKAKASKMNFGDHAAVAGAGVVSTQIVSKYPRTFYYLTLEGISVGNRRFNLDLPSSSENDESKVSKQGNIIIDSGTTLTFLPSELYYKMIKEVKRQVRLRQIRDPQGILKMCYFSRRHRVSHVPEITVHFRGANVKLKSINTFVRTSKSSVCLAFAPTSDLPIYGNLAQMNFLVGYDLEKKTVSFKPTDCSKA